MNPLDRTARTAGILFLLTFVSAITGVALYAPLLSDPGYVTGPGADTRILFGAVCELVLIIANIGTAVVLYPEGGRNPRPSSRVDATAPAGNYCAGGGGCTGGGWTGGGVCAGGGGGCPPSYRGPPAGPVPGAPPAGPAPGSKPAPAGSSRRHGRFS